MTFSANQKIIVVLGTSRDDSNTLTALQLHLPFKDFDLIELHKKSISHFNYEGPPSDDFLPIAEQLAAADVIVFATPVYWYAMSGVLKVFFDRLTDLTLSSKNLGKSLAGKKVYLFATGTDPELPEGFEVPFRKTSEYFNMEYQRAFYVCVNAKQKLTPS
jgi:multimeric flavodoxin WrbA